MLGKIDQLRQDFDGYKPTVDAINQDLQTAKQDLAATKQILDATNQDLAMTKTDLLPPIGTIMGWLPKLAKDDPETVAIPEGTILFIF